jgi:hypothetical protein
LNPSPPNKIPGYATDIYKEKTTGPQTPQILLDHCPETAVSTGKQSTRIQNNPETYLDLWRAIAGISIKL